MTVVSLALIVLIGAMAAWALSEYRFPGNTFLALYLALGIMVPIRLGSVSILRMMVELNLVNADRPRAGLRRPGPALAILILGEFIQQIRATCGMPPAATGSASTGSSAASSCP